ncbi:hypothetical protein OHB26_27595 [Nocardia sp. NBC_01503]|uniref:hypothetical protein n=1 Tax=Nocardia sp. NBC_01503 TaxID=2975997 RepID=UPI002E7B0151|nr:hypothetical protein [Nocardia sp. NBC_01503]WTL30674.1 hypothetical protein OHB26_27595 [Nocardia sp. NBC_01503]
MKTGETTRGFDFDTYDRIGIAEVVSTYGMDAVHRRIELLRRTGMHYAAKAIERELEAAQLTEPSRLLRRRSA